MLLSPQKLAIDSVVALKKLIISWKQSVKPFRPSKKIFFKSLFEIWSKLPASHNWFTIRILLEDQNWIWVNQTKYDQRYERWTYVYTDRSTCVRAVTKRRIVSSVWECTEKSSTISEGSWNGLTSLPAGCSHGASDSGLVAGADRIALREC